MAFPYVLRDTSLAEFIHFKTYPGLISAIPHRNATGGLTGAWRPRPSSDTLARSGIGGQTLRFESSCEGSSGMLVAILCMVIDQ